MTALVPAASRTGHSLLNLPGGSPVNRGRSLPALPCRVRIGGFPSGPGTRAGADFSISIKIRPKNGRKPPKIDFHE
ncbi:hypothetical protein, partial [Novosphingobium naphthalenivorans]|uniref:hypothetical protein n=1 Tax=Novosphingobium naphthalenivorans TaxID=273168 RepID=UPI001C3F196B